MSELLRHPHPVPNYIMMRSTSAYGRESVILEGFRRNPVLD